jgi:DNA-binding transcriptional LysR family regulator
MIALKQAAIAGVGVVALPGYVCREDVRLGALRQVMPAWLAGDSTITALTPKPHSAMKIDKRNAKASAKANPPKKRG